MKGKTKIVINDIFEVPYNENKAQIISMPKTENESFKIKKWLCTVGDTILEGTAICELENNKNSLEFESFITGKLVSITSETGILKTGDEICRIEKA